MFLHIEKSNHSNEPDLTLNKQFQRTYFEIIAKRPTAKHFKERMMVPIGSNNIKIIMFPTDANTFLRICRDFAWWSFLAQEHILKLNFEWYQDEI